MAENKIPVLTEVYRPTADTKLGAHTKDDPTLGVTPELIARVVGHVRPRIEEEIRQSALTGLRDDLKKELIQALRDEITHAQQAIEFNTRNFIDKTRADFKTELPAMYHASVSLAQINFAERLSSLEDSTIAKFNQLLEKSTDEALKQASEKVIQNIVTAETEISARVSEHLNQEMQAFQENALVETRTLLSGQMKSLNESAQQSLQQELQALQEKMEAEHLQQLNQGIETVKQSVQASTEAAWQSQLFAMREKIMAEHTLELCNTLQAYMLNAGTEAEHAVSQKLSAFQNETWLKHQQQLVEANKEALQTSSAQLHEDLTAHTKLLQQTGIAALSTAFDAEKQRIYESALAEVKTKFTETMTAQGQQLREQFLTEVNSDLPDVQIVLRENVEHMLAIAMPALENDLRNQLMAELKELLLKVKFVLP